MANNRAPIKLSSVVDPSRVSGVCCVWRLPAGPALHAVAVLRGGRAKQSHTCPARTPAVQAS